MTNEITKELDLNLNTQNVDMDFAFVSSAFKPKKILAVEMSNSNGVVSLVLNGDKNARVTATHNQSEIYENMRDAFEKYDILPRLDFYIGAPEEILPWIEGKFDLIVLHAPVDEELLESLLADGGHVAIEKSILGECDTCCFEQMSLENVKNYYIFK